MFTFRQFTIDDSHCAMKVGTDGVLLGAWADVAESQRVLDLGCGSGLIALMLAQRLAANASVTGIELDEAAAADAQDNVAASPYAGRVAVVCADVVHYEGPAGGYDHIVSNPPYHEEELLPPAARRAAARHTAGGGLTFAALLHSVTRLLSPAAEARFSLIIPTQALSRFLPLAACHGLFPARRTDVVTKEGKPPKRTLLELRRQSGHSREEIFPLMDVEGLRSAAYRALCAEYYL